MSGPISEFDAYVERRLEHWGWEFALWREINPLGHKSKDILQVLIEHKGEMPRSDGGIKPEPFDPVAWQIEEIISGMSKDFREGAWVLRAYYAGSGRKNVERFESAKQMVGREFSLRAYHDFRKTAFHRVAGALAAIARAA